MCLEARFSVQIQALCCDFCGFRRELFLVFSHSGSTLSVNLSCQVEESRRVPLHSAVLGLES